MSYEPQNFSSLLGLTGFSDIALNLHFTLYQGYVTNVNKLSDALGLMLSEDKVATPEYAELRRRFGWEFNGMRLHELYFSSLSKTVTTIDQASKLAQKLITDFGSVANWEKDFRATAAMRGIGWAILYYDQTADRLFNVWINEHDVGHLAGCVPLLPMDVFEHAYLTDYGSKRADYITSFLPAVDWSIISQRFENMI